MNPAPRLCARGCGTQVVNGRCPRCNQARQRARKTSTARGYDADWRRFRHEFQQALVAAGIPPACGAALPDGPRTTDSACRTAGVLTFASADGSSLAHDHEPPLEDWERGLYSSVCDFKRIQLLCAACHARKDDPGRGAAT